MLANLAQKTRLAVNKGYLFALGVEHGLAELVHINAVRLLVVVCVVVVLVVVCCEKEGVVHEKHHCE